MAKGDPHISLVVCSPEMECATALLNANAFPERIASEVDYASRRFAVLLHNVADVARSVELQRDDFAVHLARNWSPYRLAADAKFAKDGLDLIAFPDGLRYMSAINAVLYELKAFLDLYSRLVSRIVSNDEALGFNK